MERQSTLERLQKIGACEVFMKSLHFREFRVRFHGDLARIEVRTGNSTACSTKTTRDAIVKRFKEVGFNYVSLDLQGFRSGSLNEVMQKKAV